MMADRLISEQAAVDALESYGEFIATKIIKALPTAQPAQDFGRDTNVPSTDCISRKAAIDAECEVCQIAPKKGRGHNCTYYVHGCKEIECLRALPTAQPPLEEFEWCTDCKEYDQKAHCCHRFTKVIRNAVEELKVVRCKDCIYNNECEIQRVAQTTEWFYCGFGAER